MRKNMLLYIITFSIFVFSGCSCSKSKITEQINELEKEKETLSNEIEKFENVGDIFDFYSTVTNEIVNSIVVVESKNLQTNETLYCNGVIIYRNSYYYYVLTDYNSIKQNGMIKYRVMDSNASVYNASSASYGDEESGLILLQIDTRGVANISLQELSLGESTDLMAYISSAMQINKIQISKNIKTSTIDYNNTSYIGYDLDKEFIGGVALINSNYRLCGIYLSKYNLFIDSELISEILYTIYSLTL